MDTVHLALAALYLRGAPRRATLNRRMWPQVVAALRDEPTTPGGAGSVLRDRGMHQEAALLEERELLCWAETVGEDVITAVSVGYPKRWVSALGSGAPPAVWMRGEAPDADYLGIVGSRQVDGATLRFAHECGARAVQMGYGVVSGGAEGCDRAGATGAFAENGETLTLFPCGLGWARPTQGLDMSVCAPDEPFSTGNAMERNALIYAAAPAVVVAHARFRVGGTWSGATDALRRRLTSLLVRDDASQGQRALIALGGVPLEDPGDLDSAMRSSPAQGGLFGIG